MEHNLKSDPEANITVKAFAAAAAGSPLEKYSYELRPIGKEQVDIKVAYCGICHSDLSMLADDWEMTTYPHVPGHEIVGEVIRIGNEVKGINIGDKVGLSWFSRSCMHCPQCLSGHHELCRDIEQTQVGRHGGFADVVRGHWSWIIPLPERMDMAKAGPLLCAGMTVFNAIVAEGVKPTDRVGVIGIGGLGHLAVKFLKHWGCEVIAFSSNKDKHREIRDMGASRVVDVNDETALQAIQGQLNFILSTVNVSLDWDRYLQCLAPFGKLHTVGIVSEPMSIPAFSLINGARSVGGSPGGGPALIRTMLEFCVRHQIYPEVEVYPMEEINEALKRLKEGKARYRIVLKNPD
jgi:alcohol/geraniol dehydrogenase (NADP+)